MQILKNMDDRWIMAYLNDHSLLVDIKTKCIDAFSISIAVQGEKNYFEMSLFKKNQIRLFIARSTPRSYLYKYGNQERHANKNTKC